MNYYEGNDSGNNAARQRDLVLAINEYCFIQNKTDGSIKTYVGPLTTTIGGQDALVVFDEKHKQFKEISDFESAKQLFVSAPEGWYIVLKNPTNDNQHPESSKPNNIPKSINIGKKINVFGPTSFALYPGQMTRVVQGHRLRSNQYLLARVYDADAANANEGVVADIEGNAKEEKITYFPGQLLVIKGTEVSFYIPPTGIEVIAKDGKENEYIRDAVTLERLEYCILKDENGEKRYVHGPAVVFPKPTETFVTAPRGGHCFRAIELSKISGIYVKVIAEYEENGVKHPIGEELFITGNDQMIYYPRPEHAIISYDNKFMHHAIAIPAGEGRYVMNRLTGEIKTIVGPKMYLPDPRTEVVVKRKLTAKQCELWFPGNKEVADYNYSLSEKFVEKSLKSLSSSNFDLQNCVTATAFSDSSTMNCLESNAGISRGTSYTKPRTITLDNKYDGVVGIDVWTGYAINVISKTKDRKVLVGPVTKLLDYDETLEVLELSTDTPKTTDNLLETVYLRIENNKISDIIKVQTNDFVNVHIKLSYCVDFLKEYKDKWFSVENYIKYLCDKQRSLLKREAKKYNIEEFYANSTDIIRNVVLNIDVDEKESAKPKRQGRLFKENGMFVHDVDVLSVSVEREIAYILENHQEEIIKKGLELSKAKKQAEVTKQLFDYKKEKRTLEHEDEMYRLEIQEKEDLAALEKNALIEAKRREEEKATKEAEKDLQEVIDLIEAAKLERMRKEDDERIKTETQLAELEKDKQEAYAKSVATIMDSISEDLTAALESNANAELLKSISNSVNPYAMAKGESVAEVINTLLRGTSFEETIKNIKE